MFLFRRIKLKERVKPLEKQSYRTQKRSPGSCFTLLLLRIRSINFYLMTNKKADLVSKVMDLFPDKSKEQSISIVEFLISLSEVYYDSESKSNSNNDSLCA